MQIAGSTCAVCRQHVVLAREGKACPTCRVVVHRACETQSTCGRCGVEYAIPEPHSVDVRRDAIVPRSMRPGGSAALSIALVIITVFLLLFLLLFIIRISGV